MTKEEWIGRCAARYMERADLTQEQADAFAIACFDNQYTVRFLELTEYDPEVFADDDMEEWLSTSNIAKSY